MPTRKIIRANSNKFKAFVQSCSDGYLYWDGYNWGMVAVALQLEKGHGYKLIDVEGQGMYLRGQYGHLIKPIGQEYPKY